MIDTLFDVINLITRIPVVGVSDQERHDESVQSQTS